MNALALFSGVNCPKSDLMMAAFWLTLNKPESEQVPKYNFPLDFMCASRPVPVGTGAELVVLVVGSSVAVGVSGGWVVVSGTWVVSGGLKQASMIGASSDH